MQSGDCLLTKRGGGGKGQLTSGKSVKNAVLAENWMTVGADQYTCLSIPEDVILFQKTCREINNNHNHKH